MKKYIKTIEELLALKDTDTIIYSEVFDFYYKFINGTLCSFDSKNKILNYNTNFSFENNKNTWYIEVEEPIQEATKKDIGKLCKFWDSEVYTLISVLAKINNDNDDEYIYITKHNTKYKHCRRLTEEEIKEII